MSEPPRPPRHPESPSTVFGLHPRTATWLVVSGVLFAGLLGWFHASVFRFLGVFRSGVSGREVTLVLLVVLSALALLFVATALADAMYDRYFADERR